MRTAGQTYTDLLPEMIEDKNRRQKEVAPCRGYEED
jgi:hypothetical protein